ncbi:MAG: 50S ribosomal protein L11 methyltransferase [Verrucomicrobia bacterium]|jgi:ribosomal protein L11 methyltransferase|nr:50S ribosomal protein L11 methyltransferase [Verrucomicrobiota bacterium]MDA1203084.1 50S ribosomal protein L11 methyltransferase [Verrucomicrobiota bacterium]
MTSKPAPRHVRRWVRHASAHHEDAWRERLSFLGTGLVTLARPGGRLVRWEAYATDATLRHLERDFGGKIETIDAAKIARRANAPRRTLQFASDLAVIDAHGRWPATRPKPRILLRIAGAMAFGTGEHATTASCLRLLRRAAAGQEPGWTALDIGTGSGILAIAAEKFGATRVDAFDYDPRALPAARANLHRNRCTRITLTRRDLLKWRPTRRYPLVMANVFSEILCAAAPQIVATLKPEAYLILSGILSSLEQETLATFTARGLQLEAANRRGKWVTLLLRAPGR